MSLLDTIDEHYEKFDDHINEIRSDLIYAFLHKHCRYNCSEWSELVMNLIPSHLTVAEGWMERSRGSFHKERVVCSEVEIEKHDFRIYAIDNNFPILIEGWMEPELPSYIDIAFPMRFDAREYICEHDSVYPISRAPSMEGSICLLDCHPDLLKNSEFGRNGIQIIRLSNVSTK